MTTDSVEAKQARVALLSVDQMSDDQRAFYREVVDGPRGQIVGPLRAALHSPELARKWSAFGEYVRYRTVLPGAISELAILVSARRYNCRLEWAAHAAEAQRQGLPQSIIDAIGAGDEPVFHEELHWQVYEFARSLHMTGTVSEELHAAIAAVFGDKGVVELTALIGYYTLVAMTLNAHDLPIPESLEDSLVAHEGLFVLHKGVLKL